MSAATVEKLLNDKSFNLHDVSPEPRNGPLPPQAFARMGVDFPRRGQVDLRSTINGGSGTYKLSNDGKSISFANTSWTKRGLASVAGDDAQGTLKKHFEQAQSLMQSLLGKDGWYGLALSEDGRTLVLTENPAGTRYTFKTATPP